MEHLASRVEGFLAEHSGSQRVVRDQKARRKAVLDRQHASRAADAMNRRGIVGSLLSASVDTSVPTEGDRPGEFSEDSSQLLVELASSASKGDEDERYSSLETKPTVDSDDVDVLAPSGSGKASSRANRIKFMAEFATPEVGLAPFFAKPCN
jgi:hypothetical protein